MSAQASRPAGCQKCTELQKRYEENPRSIWLRLWKWHSGWCPAHKAASRQAEKAGKP